MNKHHIPARLLAMLVLAQAAVALPPEMAGYDPSKQIRFSTPAQAEARRQELIHFIWPDGLPSNTLPTVARNIAADVFDRYLPGIERKSVAAVDKLDADIAPYDFHSISYLLHPFKTNANTGKLVIYHSGHRRSVAEWAGGDDVINRLLTEGFTVLAMDMPCYGWNADDTIKLPEEKIDPNANLFTDLGVDSLLGVEIFASLDKKYGINIPEEKLRDINTLNDIIALVRESR